MRHNLKWAVVVLATCVGCSQEGGNDTLNEPNADGLEATGQPNPTMPPSAPGAPGTAPSSSQGMSPAGYRAAGYPEPNSGVPADASQPKTDAATEAKPEEPEPVEAKPEAPKDAPPSDTP